jgi:hypothetical protein
MEQERLNLIISFNEKLDNFIEYLKTVSPDKLKGKIYQLEKFKEINKLGPIQYYAIYVLPYKNQLYSGNVDYFLGSQIINEKTKLPNDNTQNVNEFMTLEKIIKEIWNNSNQNDQEECIKHMQILTSSADEYLQNVLKGKNPDYQVIDNLISMEIEKNHINMILSLVMDKEYVKANEYISLMLAMLMQN